MQDYSDAKARSNNEYATQYFGFPPESLIDMLMDDATDTIREVLQEAKKYVKKVDPDVDEKELDACFAKSEKTYVELTEDIYFKFGLYLKEHVLKIPENCVLKEDAIHALKENFGVDASDVEREKELLELLYERVKKAKSERAFLQDTIKALEKVRERQEKVTLPLAKAVEKRQEALKVLEKKVESVEEFAEAKLRPALERLENNCGPLKRPQVDGNEHDLQVKKFKSD